MAVVAVVVQFDIYFVERMNLAFVTWSLIDLYKLESAIYVYVNSRISRNIRQYYIRQNL